MRQRSNPARIHIGWQRVAPLAILAILPFSPLALGRQSTSPVPLAGSPAPLRPRLPEAPPAHPPAAPCGECSEGCGAGPHGIPNVYLHSGEFHLQEVDLVIPGRGLDFVWARTYRSRIGPDTEQGHGWDFSYNLRIATEGSAVRVMDGNGRSDLYLSRGDGSFAAAQFFREGRFELDGTFTLVFADQGSWVFFPLDGSPLEGRVKFVADRNGNTLAFDYDGLGRLTLVVDTLGREIQIAHDASGRITSVTDFLGRSVVYGYYGAFELGGNPGDLKSARSPIVVGTPNGNDFPTGKTTTYTYSKGFADERLNHNLLTVTDPKGQTWLVNEYANQTGPKSLAFDRLVRQTRGNPGDVIDIAYALVAGGGTPTYLAIVNDAVGNVSEYEYDLLGRCVVRRDFTGRADPDLRTTRFSNRPANPLRPTDPTFFETRWAYNADSRATEIVHPNGNVTQNVHELELDPMATPRSRGNLRERHRLPGTHVPVGDQSMLSEFFEYDSGFGGCCGSNFVTRHTDARGNVTEHDYDASGNRLQTRHRIPSIVEDFTYNAFGQMTSHTHPGNGKGWRQTDVWTYYAPPSPQAGYLAAEVLDAAGFALTTTWVYDAVGNALQVTDARGNTTTMVVNALDQVVRQTSPPVEMLNGVFVQYEVDTWFDANDKVVRVDTQNFDDQGNLASNAYLTSSYEYEILNREVRETAEVDATRNVVTEYEYDANRNRTLIRHGEATSGAQPTNVERLLHDERNLLFRRVRAEGDPNQSSIQHDYDGNGNLVQVTRGLEDAMPRIKTCTIDAYGRVVQEMDPMGNLTKRNYDENGNLVHERRDGELCDLPGSAANVRLFETSYVYDAMDRLVRSDVLHFDPATQAAIGDGLSRTDWTWTDRSEVATLCDDRGFETSVCYDTAGRREIVTDNLGNSVRDVYDENGNVVQVVETEVCGTGGPNPVFTSTRVYDALDRQVLVQDSAGNDTLIGYDSRDNTTRVVDALGNLTTQTYDGLDRLLGSERVLTDDGTGNGMMVGKIERAWSWDDSSRLVAQTDDNGYVTTYGYDALGRRERTTLADGKMEILTYDAHDDVVSRVDPNGTQLMSTYDLGNRISARAIVPGVGVSADTTFEIWKHDGLSRLVHAEDDDSLVTRAFDSLSNQTRETQDGKTFLCTHDGMRNELGLTYPSGELVTCLYDALNRVKVVSSTGGSVATYDYVGPWRVQRRTGGGGIGVPVRTSLYGYDLARRMTSVMHSAGAATLEHRTFGWDAMYDKTKSTDVLTGTVHDFTYDSQYRLIRSKETASGGSVVRDVRFAFNGVGNRTSVVGGACAGTFPMNSTLPEPADGQMNQYTSAPCVGSLIYDANGNQVARGGTSTLAYDYRNRLVLHTGPGGTTSFDYDALGRNVARVLPSAATIRYYYHGMDVVEERDGNDQVIATYVRGRLNAGFDNQQGWVGFNPQPEPPIGREILARDAGATRLFFLCDDLGSTRAVANAAGAVVERYRYDEAGLPSFFTGGGAPLASSAIGNAWLFTGQRWDEETSFYYYNARFMDPLLGQFLSRDPLGVWGDPVNLGNARTYVANNFQTLVDPTGMYAYSVACGGPWPGPKSVHFDKTDCGSSSKLPTALCRAMRGAGKARRTSKNWVSFELNGYPGGLSWWTAVPFLEWFGGPNQNIPQSWMLVISGTIKKVWKPFKKGSEIGIECESGCDSNVAAYVASYDSNIHLCPLWWNQTANLRGSVLLHELTHDLAGTEDHFYYANKLNPSTSGVGAGGNNFFETGTLATNADTYMGLYLKYFVR